MSTEPKSDQNANNPASNGEQPTETVVAGENGEPKGPMIKLNGPIEESTEFKTLTVRPKADTMAFFKLVEDRYNDMIKLNDSASKADATNFILKELLNEAFRNDGSLEQVAALENEVSSLREQISSLQANQSDKPDLSIVLGLNESEKKLCELICQKRFEDPGTKAKYKLEQPETPAQMLVHMLRNTDNLYNANGNFYTGLTTAILQKTK